MYKFSSKTLAALLLCGAMPLAGCVGDQLIPDEPVTPYGGSKLHPIKVVDGKAVVDKCGDWSENLADSESNEMSANHGCAVQANIAAMTAYPYDLVKLRRMGPNPAFDDAKAVTTLVSGGGGAAAAAPAAPTAPVAAGPAP